MMKEENIRQKCKERGLKCSFGCNVVFIETKVAHWRLIHNGKKITCVMHENYRTISSQCNNGNFKSGYHKQKLKDYSLDSVLDYIKCHDKRFLHKSSNSVDAVLKRVKTQRYKIA